MCATVISSLFFAVTAYAPRPTPYGFTGLGLATQKPPMRIKLPVLWAD
jgi:hypothetical protein